MSEELDAIGEAERQVYDIMCRGIAGDVARRMVRVEINHDIEREFMRAMQSMNYLRSRDIGRPLFPMKFRGVSYYVVAQLQAPGWQVINPFAIDPIRTLSERDGGMTAVAIAAIEASQRGNALGSDEGMTDNGGDLPK